MKQKVLTILLLALGALGGVLISPLNAQQQETPLQQTCSVAEGSNAACSGKWVYFAGNTSGVDSGAWVVRMNGETGEVWYKNGKRLVLLEEPK
ncbi:MAG: hypothetical protein ACR2Q3_15525 [Woeseiaceae bacterium]